MSKPYYSDELVTLYNADCRDVIADIPPAAIVATDPPYASAAATSTTGRALQKWGGSWGDMSLVDLMCRSTLDAANLAAEHEVYWFCDHLSYAALIPHFFRTYPTVQSIVWDRDMLGMGACYRKQTELIIYSRTRGAAPFQSKNARDLIRMRPDYSVREVSSQKPVGLMLELLRNSAPGLVLDPYAGSGSTVLAAAMLGLPAIGVEIEEWKCEIAARRLRDRFTAPSLFDPSEEAS